MAFVRKNTLVITVGFTAADGTITQPSAVTCHIMYPDLSNVAQTADVNLTYSPVTNMWTGLWDSSVAGPGIVSWVAYGSGTLQAAKQGEFEILANAANNI